MKYKNRIVYCALVISCAACGGGGSHGFNNNSFEVDSVDIDRTNIAVGETTRAEVFFNTEDDFGGPEDVVVVVALSSSISYVPGSGRVFDDSTSDTDPREPDEITRCPGGGSFAVFRFDDDELEDIGLFNGGFGLRIDIKGESRDPDAEVEAAADDHQFFACGSGFDGEASDTTEVR